MVHTETWHVCLQVAILCNHQRAVPKTHEKSMQAMDEKIEKAEENLASLKKDLKLTKSGKPTQDGKSKNVEVYVSCCPPVCFLAVLCSTAFSAVSRPFNCCN